MNRKLLVALLFSSSPLQAQPMPQPDLRQQLDAAPLLAVEELGELARSVTTYGAMPLVPNPDGKSYDVLRWYYKEYGGPTWLYAIDLGSGEVVKQRFPDARQIHLAGQTLGPDGKYYLATSDWGNSDAYGGMNLFVYDPATNRLEDRGNVVKGLGGEKRDMFLGPDGYLYGTGSYRRPAKVGLYRIDPKTGAVRDYGPLGPEHVNQGVWADFLVTDDQYAYIASSKNPWWLVAVNLDTGAEKVILEAEPGYTQMVLGWRDGGPYARVKHHTGDTDWTSYWLWHGEAIPQQGERTLPKLDRPLPPQPPRPELWVDDLVPNAEGEAKLWHRPAGGAGEWQRIALTGIPFYPLPIHRLALLPDGRIMGASQGYLGRFTFDPRTGQGQRLGDGSGSSYTYQVAAGKVFFSGYPFGPLYVYDPARPWTIEVGGPPGQPAIKETDPRSNPRQIGLLRDSTRMTKALAATTAADGLVYVAGRGVRDYAGGGLGWIDPRTLEFGGVWKPFSAYQIHWLIPIHEGRQLVLGTRATQDELNHDAPALHGRLIVWDVAARQVVRYVEPVPGERKAGPVLEVAPGRLLGLTDDPANATGSVLYSVAIDRGEMLWRQPLPGRLGHRWQEGVSQWDFQRGPDGGVYCFLDNTLVRIDLATAAVTPLGRVAQRGKLLFVGDDLY